MQSRKEIQLSTRQTIIAEQCEILIRSLAKVGIIALVDEATGFQQEKDRIKNEYQKFLSQFMREEAAKLVKRFDDSFFETIYKMRDWTWNDSRKHPGVVGNYINNIVYERLVPLVLHESQERNPVIETGRKKYKHHQFLSEDKGIPKLFNHLAAVEALARAANYNWNIFMGMLDKAFPIQYQQLELFEKEYGILNKLPDADLSSHNKGLKNILANNPKN